MSSPDFMIFDMDISMHQKKMFNGEGTVPLAPPPSPNLTKRKFGNLTPIPMSRLIDCCEELVIKQTTKNICNTRSSKPLSMKRKTSDSDEYCSSSTSSAGTSPGGTPDCSRSFGKRSRSSLDIDSGSFRRLNFSLSELSAAIADASSETNDQPMMEL